MCDVYKIKRSTCICVSVEIFRGVFPCSYNKKQFHVFFRGAYRYVRLLLSAKYYEYRNMTICKAFAQTVKKYGSKPALLFEDESWSFQDLEDYSNRVGNYFLDLGYKVCMLHTEI